MEGNSPALCVAGEQTPDRGIFGTINEFALIKATQDQEGSLFLLVPNFRATTQEHLKSAFKLTRQMGGYELCGPRRLLILPHLPGSVPCSSPPE